MMGRMGTTYAKWKKPEPCPLCHGEAETQLHFIISCPELQAHRSSRLANLQEFYLDEEKEPPRSVEELYSAVINGDCYATTTCGSTTEIVREPSSGAEA